MVPESSKRGGVDGGGESLCRPMLKR